MRGEKCLGSDVIVHAFQAQDVEGRDNWLDLYEF